MITTGQLPSTDRGDGCYEYIRVRVPEGTRGYQRVQLLYVRRVPAGTGIGLYEVWWSLLFTW